MRILHVTDCYLPRVGGIELHIADLVSRQRSAGHDARVVTMTPHDVEAHDDPPWIHRGAEVDGRHLSPSRMRTYLEALVNELAPDVVHVHISVFSPFSTMGARAVAQLALPTLVTVHSMWSHLGPLPGLASGALGLRAWPVVWSAVSAAAAAPVQRMVGPAHVVRVLHNAVEPNEWARQVPLAEAGTGDIAAPLTIVSVMRLTHVKRALPLASMLGQVRKAVPDLNVRAVIIGDGPQRAALERYVRRHDLGDWVSLAGRLDRAAIRTELDTAAIFWAPAELESFGIAPLEARTRGVPVVASSLSGVGDYITHGVEGLLGGSDAEMVRHVVSLLTDDGLRKRIALHNSRVRPQHDWQLACRSHDELYDEARTAAASRDTRAWAGGRR